MTRAERRPGLSLPYRVRDREGPSDTPPPLLLLLHGRGGNELAMAALAGEFDPRFVVLSPRAPIEMEPYAYQWFPETFTADGPSVSRSDLDEATATLSTFIDEAVDAFAADSSLVCVAGFSQGGTLALAALLSRPDRVAAAVSMSGWLPPAATSAAVSRERLTAKPVLVVHGSRDDTIAARYGREAHAALRELGLAAEHREPDIGHTTTPESVADAAAWLTERLDQAPGPE